MKRSAVSFTLVATMSAALCIPALPSEAADAAAGRKKARQCQTCHGIDGIAKIPIAPHIAGESEIYLVTQLKAFRSGKRTHEIMTVIAKDLSDQDMADLAAWYASIEITATLPE
ncbi:cytochrome c [Pelagibius sp.]|uniref:c-type cytochrome n=1 Tax=Pelagibius sp. TaxID=1931238 RepID=UPI00262886CC|nr:cytochrome c [Pelagibius sp.]